MADVATPTAAPTPFPAGDPRNAKYFENLAALKHTLKNTLAGDEASREAARAAEAYSSGQLDRQLPLTMQATRNAANSQGLLESGQLAQRAGGVEAKYAAQRGRLTSGLQQTEGRITNAERSASEAFDLNRTRAASTAREEGLKGLEQEAPNTQPPATQAVNPGGSRAILGPPGAGGVQPYAEKTPGGSVLVGATREQYQLARAPMSRNATVRARQEAARKALGVG